MSHAERGVSSFRLRLITPARVVMDEDVVSVVARDASGSFGVLPRHEPLAAALVPSILTIQTAAGRTTYAAVDRGLLRKSGAQLTVAVRQAVVGDDYRALEGLIERRLTRLAEAETVARSAFSRLGLSVAMRLFGYERGR
jgi:F-type H+-transporting ATPase subunit epsilon